jgi:hypothetical protein
MGGDMPLRKDVDTIDLSAEEFYTLNRGKVIYHTVQTGLHVQIGDQLRLRHWFDEFAATVVAARDLHGNRYTTLSLKKVNPH